MTLISTLTVEELFIFLAPLAHEKHQTKKINFVKLQLLFVFHEICSGDGNLQFDDIYNDFFA